MGRPQSVIFVSIKAQLTQNRLGICTQFVRWSVHFQHLAIHLDPSAQHLDLPATFKLIFRNLIALPE